MPIKDGTEVLYGIPFEYGMVRIYEGASLRWINPGVLQIVGIGGLVGVPVGILVVGLFFSLKKNTTKNIVNITNAKTPVTISTIVLDVNTIFVGKKLMSSIMNR